MDRKRLLKMIVHKSGLIWWERQRWIVQFQLLSCWWGERIMFLSPIRTILGWSGLPRFVSFIYNFFSAWKTISNILQKSNCIGLKPIIIITSESIVFDQQKVSVARCQAAEIIYFLIHVHINYNCYYYYSIRINLRKDFCFI